MLSWSTSRLSVRLDICVFCSVLNSDIFPQPPKKGFPQFNGLGMDYDNHYDVVPNISRTVLTRFSSHCSNRLGTEYMNLFLLEWNPVWGAGRLKLSPHITRSCWSSGTIFPTLWSNSQLVPTRPNSSQLGIRCGFGTPSRLENVVTSLRTTRHAPQTFDQAKVSPAWPTVSSAKCQMNQM